MNHRVTLLAGALLTGTGVAAGALGAHGRLNALLTERGMLHAWETGTHYQQLHGVALLALAGWLRAGPGDAATRPAMRAAWCWIIGAMLFSGSLYLLAAGAPAWVGPITPIGGVGLLAGWAYLIVAAFAAKGD
ncbi:MAG TPA: DUF423 domain-containing protein [Opitutaceae bacterium]|jgi:uncharacterized membrane protein YgdD (TMEM256/DUF423 family)|nr:DUF423 domain-containing protein [Opitutaceae bacterium]